MHPDKAAEIISRLLLWHKRNRRVFPWRENPSPYHVLLAEMMLQRTPPRQVVRVFKSFVQEFPDPKSVVKAGKERVLKFLEPLGLRHRNEKIYEVMRALVDMYDGKIPDTLEELTRLPGVDRYIASAVLSFAYRKDVPIVDRPIARVLVRIFGLKTDKRPDKDSNVWNIAKRLIPRGRGPEFNEALIDFAALICRSKPLCEKCPLVDLCLYATRTPSALKGC